MLRDRIAAVLPHWDASDPEYGYLLGMHAFGLEETGDYDRALATAHKSLELIPDNAAAIHVIAHVLEMRGPPDKGIAWLRETQPIWSANAGFRIHLAWHLALFQLDADAAADALATYDELIAPRPRWRQQRSRRCVRAAVATAAARNRIAARWREVTRALDAPAHDRQPRLRPRACGDGVRGVEAARARPPIGEAAAARRMLRARSGSEELALAEPLIAAIMSFCRGDYDATVESISAIRAAADRCGGSVAQCDLIHLTLLEAALRGKQKRLARTLAPSAPCANPRASSIAGSRHARGHGKVVSDPLAGVEARPGA